MSGQRNGSSCHAKAPFGLGRLRSLYNRAGRAPAKRSAAKEVGSGQVMEQLEARILLGGDHPSFDLPLSPTSGTEIIINGTNGEGTEDGTIEGVTPDVADDLFRFVAPESDFVTVWGDTVNVGGSDLDSRVEVYDIDGMLIAEGSSQGQLTGGFFDDGWTHFLAEAGETYFVRILSDVDNFGQMTTGDYTVRIDAITNKNLVIETDPMAAPPARFGAGAATGTITIAGDDAVYRVEAGSDSAFNSLATFYAGLQNFPPSDLDTRVDVYNEQGQLLTGNSDTGRLQTGFDLVQSAADAVFFVRVRSDRFDPALTTATGAYTIRAEMVATTIDIDPVTRRGQVFDGIADAFDTRIYRFTTQGSGLTFAGAVGAGLVPLPQPALRLYDMDTSLAGFSDLAGLADLQIQLETNTEYFIVIETFDNPPGGTYNVFIESNHTFIPTQDVDDHQDRPTGEDPDGEDLEFGDDEGFTNPAQFDFIRRQFDQATPLRFSDPFLYTRTFVDPLGMFDDVVNPVSDRSYVQQALGSGRIHSFGDTDLFQFTLPLDMLGDYEGDDGDEGDALFAGGEGDFIIKGTDNDTGGPITRSFLGIWDAQDWWPVRAGVDMTIYSMETWEYDPDADIGGTALILGGEFQFADFQAAPFVAAYAYDPLVGEYVLTPLAGGLDGAVFDFGVFDFDTTDDIESQLIVAGEFTGGIAQYQVQPGDFIADGAFFGLPILPTGGNVYAIEVWDPADPEMGDANELGLYYGGDGGFVESIVIVDDAPEIGPTIDINQGAGDGVVLDLKVIQIPDDMGGDPTPALAIGGSFDDVDGQGGNNVVTLNVDPATAMNPGEFTYDIMANGVNDTVRALETWDRDGSGTDFDEELIVGGDFTATTGGQALGFIGTYTGAWADVSTPVTLGATPGFNAPVHSLRVFIDQEFGVGTAPFAENPVLYVGGEFTMADGIAASRIAQLTFDPFFLVWTFTPMGFGSTDTVFALANFNDELPDVWDRDDRTAARARLTISPDFLPGAQTFVRVYDSAFRVVYTNDTIAPPFPDPSGALDPSLLGADNDGGDLVIDIGGDQESQFWAGETYYLEISSIGGNGRYSFSMVTDALPPDVDGDGTFDDVISQYGEPGGSDLIRSEFDAAQEIVLGTTTSGDGRNFLALPNAAYQVRSFDVTPSGFAVTQYQELGMIERIEDFDIFFFRAPDNGTTEIRLATQQITDEFVEDIVDLNVVPPALDRRIVNKTYDSPLDGKIRVFNNDLQLVASNNDNDGFAGTRSQELIGTLDLIGDTLYGAGDTEIEGRIFNNVDPRVVLPIERGEVYFVVVESGQLDAYTEDPDLVDWRRALGSYELLINSAPNLEFADDHQDISPLFIDFFTNDSVLPIDEQGRGEIRGEIRTRSGGVEDNDAFVAFAVGSGDISITVTADNPGEFRPRVTIFDSEGNQRVSPTSATSTAPAEVEFGAIKGERYIIRVDANVGEQGGYTIEVDGPASVDDYADAHRPIGAQDIEILDFLGRGEISGAIDASGDTDIFKFTTPGFGEVQIDVESTEFGFDPIVRVYEVSEDPAGNAIFLPIAFNDNRSGGTVDARVLFPVSGADRTSTLTMKTFNDYYVVVEGANQQGSSGTYDLTITSTPTDDHPDEGEFAFASDLFVAPLTGQGERAGLIEVENDDDLFTFIAPAGGEALLSAVSNELSTLRPTIRVFDADFNPVINLTTGTDAVVTGPDGIFSAASYRFDVTRAARYYVLVGSDATGSATTGTGAYTLNATTPTADEHANEGEFELASEIVLSTETGAGERAGNIATINDTDLFFFDSIVDASTTPQEHTVRVDASGETVTPVLSVFDAGTSLLSTVVDGGAGDLAPEDGIIEVDISVSGTPGQRFFLLVELDDSSMFPTGAYTVTVEGPIPDVIPTPGDDHANRGQFSQATVIDLDERTGNAEITGRIDPSADSDLFRINPLSGGLTFVQVVTPSGSLLDVDLTVFEQFGGGGTPVQIDRDTTGFQGVNAGVEFDIAGVGTPYFLLVSGLNSATGEYTLRVDTQPETFFLYYPEGFVNEDISEFVSISNPSASETVSYTIRLFYENPDLADMTLVENETLQPGSRGGVTIAERGGFVFPGVQTDEPYSIVIESTGQLGATLSHYDFEGAIGEAFTPITSDTWAFGRLERSPGQVESFLVFFNPNPHDVIVTLTANNGGSEIQIQQTVEATSRGGWELSALGQLPLGVFGATLTSEPADTTGQPSIGIVAALSHYDLVAGEAFGVLGDPTGGSTFNVVPSFTSGSEVTGELVLYNPGDAAATVTITSDYVTAPLPSVQVLRTVNAGQTVVLRASDLSLAADVTAGITISSTQPLAGVVLEQQNGDANAIATQSTAASTWFFGDAFLNSAEAGLTYFETLSFFNPTNESIAVEITLFFNDGTTENTVRQVGAGGFNNLRLDAFAPILDRQMLNFFSIQVSSNLPIIASLTHYDLELDGGWTNAGAPLGLTNPLERIVI
ncbi:MAG: hypothetical protein NCW75_03620 [Phycisphaera sp.]|nr:MAG: hypothetical protein NCW75_03620 [Phycisphaera sp.]